MADAQEPHDNQRDTDTREQRQDRVKLHQDATTKDASNLTEELGNRTPQEINQLTGRQRYGQDETEATVPLQHGYKPHEELTLRFPYLPIGQEIVRSQQVKRSEPADDTFTVAIMITATRQTNITNFSKKKFNYFFKKMRKNQKKNENFFSKSFGFSK